MLKNKWFHRFVAVLFLGLGFCTVVPPAQAQRVKASFSENNPLGPDLIFLLEELQEDGSWAVRYSAPSSPMIFAETPGIHTYRVRARFLSTGLNSQPSNEATIELFAPPNTPGMDTLLRLEQTDEPINVDPPPA
jgi:hypothetical protein